MANQFQVLFPQTTLTASSAVVCTLPTLPTSLFLKNGRVVLVNTTANLRNASLHADVAATATSAANAFALQVAVPGYAQVQVDIPQIPAGYTIRALADAAAAINIWPTDGFFVVPG